MNITNQIFGHQLGHKSHDPVTSQTRYMCEGDGVDLMKVWQKFARLEEI